ncbi:hypothetical protein FRC06_007890 [Ceratobasidium sp. 370]|nr:hypothetical protein FRC06_007890 [Ceratobasidium sp. 370]
MSDDIRGVFDSIIARGFGPQVLEAYNEHDNIIYPNDVPAKLSGAIVCVTCTIEKALFKGSRFAGGKEWQFYANVAKVEVLSRSTLTCGKALGMTSLKRKRESNEHDDADPTSKPLSTD